MADIFPPVVITDINLPWESILHLGTPINFPAKQVLDSLEHKNTMYYVRKGIVRLSQLGENGKEKVLCYLGKGAIFNDSPVIVQGTQAFFTVAEPLSAVAFKYDFIHSNKFVVEHPDIILNWLESMCKKTVYFSQRLWGPETLGAFHSTCNFLYSMALHNKEKNNIVPLLSKQELADLIGIHRGSLHKVFARLQDEGIMESYSKSSLKITDLEQLRIYATN